MHALRLSPFLRCVTSIGVPLTVGLAMTGCVADTETGGSGVVVFENAHVIRGDGSASIRDAVFLIENGRFTAVGPREAVEIPTGAARVDLDGKTVIPAFVNTHVHLASNREERTAQLQHMAYYGAGTVISLGHDLGEVPFEMRDEFPPNGARGLTAGRGITAPEPGRTDAPYWVTTEEEARAAVRELAARNVNFIKIWVDDRGGQYEKLSPTLYGAIIDEAHMHDARVTAHVFTLEDAKGLLRAGIDAFAHGVRDRDVDDELIALWRERPNVVLVPNLPNPGVAMDMRWIGETVPDDMLQEIQEGAIDRPQAQEQFAIQARNLKRLSDAGMTIGFGTDGSTPWAVHLELEDMVRAGMTRRQVIAAATGNSAALLRLEDVGTISAGKQADFIVLNGNPLDDIKNTRQIDAVYLRGVAVERSALAARFRGTS